MTQDIMHFPRWTVCGSEKSRYLLKRASFILADVLSDVLSPSHMHTTAFSIEQQFRQ